MRRLSGRLIFFLVVMLVVNWAEVWGAAGDLVWKFAKHDSAQLGYISPSIGKDGTIYFGSGDHAIDDDYLYAINPDGSEK